MEGHVQLTTSPSESHVRPSKNTVKVVSGSKSWNSSRVLYIGLRKQLNLLNNELVEYHCNVPITLTAISGPKFGE